MNVKQMHIYAPNFADANILYGHYRNQIHWCGVQWLSGRVFDPSPRGCRFETHRRYCVVVLEQDTFIIA